MPAKKQPKKFISKKKPTASVARSKAVTPRARKSTRVAKTSVKRATVKKSAPISKKKRTATKAPKVVTKATRKPMNERGYVLQKLQVTRFYPDFSDVDELIRFAAYMYLLALTPVLTQLLASVNILNTPDYVAYDSYTATEVAQANVPARPVLGENIVAPNREVIREVVPTYPTWKVSYYENQNSVVPLYVGEEVHEVVDFDLIDVPALDQYEQMLITWETQYENDLTDLYNFSIDSDATGRVYLDGELLLTKTEADLPSVAESLELTEGSHSLKVELDMSFDTASFEFLFY